MIWLTVIWSIVAFVSLTPALLHRLVVRGKHTARAIPAIAFPGLLLGVVFLAGVISSPVLGEVHQAAPGENVLSDASRVSPITIVYPVVMPPYTFKDDKGEAQGLAVDLLRLWSKKTGIPIQFKSAPWEEGLRAMREGNADVHASAYHSVEREAYLDYAAVVAPSEGRIFWHKSIVNINGPEDLKGFRVGVVRGGYHERYLQEHVPEVSLVSYPEFPDMLVAAQQGDIRVFVDDTGATLYRLRERGLSDDFHSSPGPPLYSNNFWIRCEGRQPWTCRHDQRRDGADHSRGTCDPGTEMASGVTHQSNEHLVCLRSAVIWPRSRL